MKFNTQFEDLEQQNPELIHDLQQIHQMTGEEREALSRIEARLTRSAPWQQLELETPSSSSQREYIPFSTRRDPKKLWPQRMGLIAALIVVALMTGAIVPTFMLMKGTTPGYKSRPMDVPIHVGFVMFTEQVGWIISDPGFQGPVRRTIDGGKTWKTVKLPKELAENYFMAYAFDENTLQIQPINKPPVAPEKPSNSFLYFYRTTNAGATWQRYNWPTTPEIAQAGLAALDWTFYDVTHGWVNVSRAWNPGTAAQLKAPDQTLFRTDDGGKTWQQVAHLPFPYQTYNLTFIDSQTGWLITFVNKSSTPAPEYFSVIPYVTHDGGRTWKQRSIPDPPQGSGVHYGPQDMAFFSKQEGYILAYDFQENNTVKAYLLTTQDGGDSWQIIEPAIPEDDYFRWTVIDAVHIFNGLYMYTLRNGQWVKTSTLPPGSEELHVRFEFFSSQMGMAVVDDYVLYKTRDGGKTWQKIGTLPKGL